MSFSLRAENLRPRVKLAEETSKLIFVVPHPSQIFHRFALLETSDFPADE